MKPPVLPAPMRVHPWDLRDQSHLIPWLVLVRYHVGEIVKAANDGLRPPSKRRMKRGAAAYAIALGARNVGRLLEAATLAIPEGVLPAVEGPDMDPPSER